MTTLMNQHAGEEYELEDLKPYTIHAYGKVFKYYYPVMWDTPDTIVVHNDGEVWIASAGFRPNPEDGWWYMGDEDWMVGQVNLDEIPSWEDTLHGLYSDEPDVYRAGPCRYPED